VIWWKHIHAQRERVENAWHSDTPRVEKKFPRVNERCHVTLEPHKITKTREQKSLNPFISLTLSNNNVTITLIVLREKKERSRGTHHIFSLSRKTILRERERERERERGN
jgi:hypothetical protein